MGSEWSSQEPLPEDAQVPSPEPDEDAKAEAERDRAYIERLQQIDPDRVAKAREATRRRLGLIDVTPRADGTAESAGRAASLPADTKLSDYDFPFENLVFEGGGGKGRIYGGALKCLRDAGIKARRFAGSSAGAITAALMAINVTPEEIDEIMSKDLKALLIDDDSWTAYFKRLSVFLKKFGFYDAEKFVDFFGEILKNKTGNADITFHDVYEQFGNELCVTAVNVNLMSIMYFHPKTTPSTPVRTAVRMSMSIPALFTAVPYAFTPIYKDSYVDGGVLCNYPIHVFDGWWLSMELEDNFFRKLRPFESLLTRIEKSDRFGTFNSKTLGFVVYAYDEDQDRRPELDQRIANLLIPRPNTPLYRKKLADREASGITMEARMLRSDVVNRFVDTLLDSIKLKGHAYYISRDEFADLFKNLKPKADSPVDALTSEDASELFGQDYDPNTLFDRADTKKQGEVRVYKLFLALEKELDIHARFLGHGRKDIKGVKEYWVTLLDSLQHNAGKVYSQAADLDRTVGLYTDYVGTMDFSIDKEDQDFLNEQGYKTTEMFLRDYISKNELKPRTNTA